MVNQLIFFVFTHKDGYISAVKAVLKQVVCLDKSSQGDCAETNGQTNGFAENGNGNHKDNGEVEAAMDAQEEGESLKSPSAPKGKGRRSKADCEPKSESCPHHPPPSFILIFVGCHTYELCGGHYVQVFV